MVQIDLPLPTTFIDLVWLGIGLTFGRAFGKNLDYDIQQSDWFKKLPKWQAWFVRRMLDFLHHWYMGALIMLCTSATEYFFIGRLPISAYWFGYGLFLDDLPDIPARVRKLISYLGKQTLILETKGGKEIELTKDK